MPDTSAMLLVAAFGLAALGPAAAQPTHAEGPSPELAAGLAGTWELAVDDRSEACRLVLRAQKSDKGDYFLGMPPACRHAMPSLAKVGRWGLPDATHLTLDEPGGAAVLSLALAGSTFTGTQGARVFTLTRIAAASAAGDPATLDGPVGQPMVVPVAHKRAPAAGPEAAPARVVPDRPADLAGRYAVMREKHDTGCMLTLDDQTRGKAGGDRAQLAPGCRDQGIVIFDPVGWRLVRGGLVLTARAGHSTRLDKVDDGRWAKDAKDGGKPLGLKKL